MGSNPTSSANPLVYALRPWTRIRDIVVWMPRSRDPPFRAFGIPPKRDRIRHRRKYAEGNMHHRSFYFRGPDGRHNLRAQNLAIFTQIADGIDDETWLFHLQRGDYSRWLRAAVKDAYLADPAQRIEQRSNLPSAESRNLIRKLIERATRCRSRPVSTCS